VEMSKLTLGEGDGLQQQTGVAADLAPLAQCRQDFAQLVTSLTRQRQTNLEDTRHREASLPGWEMLCKCKIMSFQNFAGTMGQKTPVETSPTRKQV
jgi:hypothetical protein